MRVDGAGPVTQLLVSRFPGYEWPLAVGVMNRCASGREEMGTGLVIQGPSLGTWGEMLALGLSTRCASVLV